MESDALSDDMSLLESLSSPLCFHSKNENNSHSEVVPYKLEVVVQADVILQG